jgi:hypothetical protein
MAASRKVGEGNNSIKQFPKPKLHRIEEYLIKHGHLSSGDFALIMRGHY